MVMQMGSRKSEQTKNNFIESIRIESKLSSNRIESNRFLLCRIAQHYSTEANFLVLMALGDVLRPSLREGAAPGHPAPPPSAVFSRAPGAAAQWWDPDHRGSCPLRSYDGPLMRCVTVCPSRNKVLAPPLQSGVLINARNYSIQEALQ